MAQGDNYKEGVDFEWVDAKDSKGNVVKDGKGKPVKTRRFFKKSEKAARANPVKEAPAKPAKAPAKPAKSNNTVRPEGKPASLPAARRTTNSVRPEGKAAGMPAKKDTGLGTVVGASAAAAGTAAATRALAGRGGRAPRAVTPRNPSYTGRATMPEGFRGRFETGLARAAGRGAGMRRMGPGGAGMKAAIDKARDPLMLMAKGGMVKKKK